MGRQGAGSVLLAIGIGVAVAASPAWAVKSQLPNLVPARPSAVHLANIDPNFPELPRAIRFESIVGNLGEFPFDVTGMPNADGNAVNAKQCVEWAAVACVGWRNVPGPYPFSPQQPVFWRAPSFVIYELRSLLDGTPDWSPGGVKSTGGRTSVCPRDDGYIGSFDGPLFEVPPTRSYPVCSTLRMGISPGWYYFVPAHFAEQYVAVQEIPDGRYALVIRVDVDNQFAESNESDNTAYTLVELYEGGTKLRVLRD